MILNAVHWDIFISDAQYDQSVVWQRWHKGTWDNDGLDLQDSHTNIDSTYLNLCWGNLID